MSKPQTGGNRSEKRRPPLKISSESEFEALMEEIDRELIDEGLGIPARLIKAGLTITGRYDIVLEAIPPERRIVPDSFTAEQISLRIREDLFVLGV